MGATAGAADVCGACTAGAAGVAGAAEGVVVVDLDLRAFPAFMETPKVRDRLRPEGRLQSDRMEALRLGPPEVIYTTESSTAPCGRAVGRMQVVDSRDLTNVLQFANSTGKFVVTF